MLQEKLIKICYGVIICFCIKFEEFLIYIKVINIFLKMFVSNFFFICFKDLLLNFYFDGL